jgi:hypothetical protein
LLTDLAFHGGWAKRSDTFIVSLGVQRTHLHIKVEIEHGDDEKPEKLAAEICRQVLKVYGVRSCEVSSMVAEADR